MDLTNERILKQSLQSGNEKAIAFLMDQYHQRLCSYAFSLSTDYELSKDMVQNVFIKLWEKRGEAEKIISIKSFLYRSVHNSLIDHWRKNKRILSIEGKHLETLTQLIENESDEVLQAQIKLVNREIENLPPKCKATFLMRKKEGLTVMEIAEVMNVSKRTVEAHINKAFNLLRKRLNDKVNSVMFLFFRPV
jgi:RNA polymerase sigma-70 factor (family 1)